MIAGKIALDLDKMIKQVYFNGNRTIVRWVDGDKTVVTCQPDDEFDYEKGLMAAIIKYITGNTGKYNEVIQKWVDDDNANKVRYTLTEKGKRYLDYQIKKQKAQDASWKTEEALDYFLKSL